MIRGLYLATTAALLLISPPSGATKVVEEKGGVRVSVNASLVPKRLPRRGYAPVALHIGGRIRSSAAASPPQLRTLTIAINAHGQLRTQGLPRCLLASLRPSTNREALEQCRTSLIGDGHLTANVKLPGQSPFPSRGRILAFNGRLHGRPAILAHIYGPQPLATSYVLPFLISRARGTYGIVLRASLPNVTGDWGYLTGLSLRLKRNFLLHGERRSYLNATCPAPPDVPRVSFPLIRSDFAFAGGLQLSSVVAGSCQARR